MGAGYMMMQEDRDIDLERMLVAMRKGVREAILRHM